MHVIPRRSILIIIILCVVSIISGCDDDRGNGDISNNGKGVMPRGYDKVMSMRFSDDGSTIAMIGMRDNAFDLITTDLEGQNIEVISENMHYRTPLTWFHGENTLVYAIDHSIYKIEATHNATPEHILTSPDNIHKVDISSDGALLMWSDDHASLSGPHIYQVATMDLPITNPSSINIKILPIEGWMPRFSPNAMNIAYRTRHVIGDDSETINIADINGDNVQTGPTDNSIFSPSTWVDDDHILYGSEEKIKRFSVNTMSADSIESVPVAIGDIDYSSATDNYIYSYKDKFIISPLN